MCGPDGALLRAALTSSSNILKHVKRKHPDQMSKLKVEKKIKSRTPRTELRMKVSALIDWIRLFGSNAYLFFLLLMFELIPLWFSYLMRVA